ncbi:MAG TPA: pyridoxal phosphate-dependent aminotransferase family protein, partial [Actinomycetota bacterium]|nr:pyridoxal phosphate-dependent aminotransferase family protein [Actinomycetota bacterium]
MARRPAGPDAGHPGSATSRRPASTRPWLDRWLAANADLADLHASNPQVDAVIEEIDGRRLRIGDRWLIDFASCNYLGFDLDRQI